METLCTGGGILSDHSSDFGVGPGDAAQPIDFCLPEFTGCRLGGCLFAPAFYVAYVLEDLRIEIAFACVSGLDRRQRFSRCLEAHTAAMASDAIELSYSPALTVSILPLG
jgi:hypothetical protein